LDGSRAADRTGAPPDEQQPLRALAGRRHHPVHCAFRIPSSQPAAGAAQQIDRSIDQTGYVRSTLVNRAESYTNGDDNDLSHDRGGLLSMRRGGGEFEFLLTPAANTA